MPLLLSTKQAVLTSWILTVSRWLFVAGHIHFVHKASEYFDYKIGVGNLSQAEPLNNIAGMLFYGWVSLILVAFIIAFITPKTEKGIIILLQVIVLPSLELIIMLFMNIGS